MEQMQCRTFAHPYAIVEWVYQTDASGEGDGPVNGTLSPRPARIRFNRERIGPAGRPVEHADGG